MRTSLQPCRAAPLAAIALALALGGVPLARAADDWAQQGQNSGATGFNSDQTAIGPANLPALKPRWSRDLDVWGQATGVSIADGQLYVARRLSDPDTTIRPQVMRLDLATGKTVWKANAPESFGTPLLTPDLVIVAGTGLETGDKTTPVNAYDRATGERRWHFAFPGTANTVTAPHLSDGVVYLAAYYGNVAALDAATGNVRWHRRVEEGCCGVHGLAVEGGVVVISDNSGLLALDATDGHDLWRYDVPAGRLVSKRPMIVNGMALAFDHNGEVYAMDLATGALRWQRLTPRGDIADDMDYLSSDGQRVFALNGVVRPMMSALDATNGQVLWSVKLGAWSHGMVLSNGVLYVAGEHRIRAFDPASGAEFSMATLKSMRWGELSISQGYIVFSGGPVQAYGVDGENRLAAKTLP